MEGSVELRSNSQQHYLRLERDPAMAGAQLSSIPVRQLFITGYRGSRTAVVMLGNDIWKKDRAARFTLYHEDLLPLADAIRELHGLMEHDLKAD